MRRPGRRLLLWLLLLSLVAGCARQAATPPPLLVLCAASLRDVVDEMAPEGQPLSIQSGGSRTVLELFKAGAPADILLLADGSLLSELEEIPKEATVFASNSLVLVRPSGQEVSGKGLADPETLLAVADPRAAPLGLYTRQALAPDSIAARRVYLKDASAVLAAVGLAHADLGVVYRSDLLKSTGVEVLSHLDGESHDRIEYVAVLPLPARPEARRLFTTLTSSDGQRLLEQAGFVPVNTR